jgi:hypothetical protein
MFLVALDAQDAERRAAELHIEHCARCRAVWQESRSLLAMLDDAAKQEPISVALLQRTQATLLGAQARPWYARASLWGWLLGGFCSLALFWAQLGAPVQPALHAESPPGFGWRCTGLELALAGAAFVLGLVGTRAAARELGPAGASLLAMSGALVGQWLLESRCESEQTALHLLLFHAMGVGVAACLGAAAGQLQQSFGQSRS